MNIAICDDEIQYLDYVAELVEKWSQLHNIDVRVHRFTNGDDLIIGHQKQCMDLIILDIIMPLIDGINTAKELRSLDKNVPIIFLTSSKEFALDSYEVRAFHYLIKPVEQFKIFETLNEFYEKYQETQESFTAKTSLGFRKINILDVDYIEAQNKVVIVCLINGVKLEIRELFTTCQEIFTLEKGFFKCHRSYIVNLRNVELFTKTQLQTKYHNTIPVSRNCYPGFKEAYFSYMFQGNYS